MFNSKCGYCSPCFTLTNLEATPDHWTDAEQAAHVQEHGTEVWKLTYTLCLTDVKCLKALSNTRVTILIDKDADYSVPGRGGLSFVIKPDGKICLTGNELKVLGPKVCCEIRERAIPFGRACKSCCDLLKKVLMEPTRDAMAPDVFYKPLCNDGQRYFEVGAPVRNIHMVTMAVSNTIRDIYNEGLIKEEWNYFINKFSAGDKLDKLYDSADWHTCRDCPESCC